MQRVVSSGAWLDNDLLRQRREQFGHQRPEIIPVRTLLIRGTAFGAVLPLLALLACLWCWLTEMRLLQTTKQLQPSAAAHDVAAAQIQAEQVKLNALVATNQGMAKAMADVRSSSAVLAELRRLVPQTVDFDQSRINGNVLELSGTALQPNALRKLNALLLSLAESGLFQADGVVLKKASLQGSGGNALPGTQRLSYSMTAAFAPDAPKAIRPQLLELGATGLALRLQRIQQEEDLLP